MRKASFCKKMPDFINFHPSLILFSYIPDFFYQKCLHHRNQQTKLPYQPNLAPSRTIIGDFTPSPKCNGFFVGELVRDRESDFETKHLLPLSPRRREEMWKCYPSRGENMFTHVSDILKELGMNNSSLSLRFGIMCVSKQQMKRM